MENKKPYVIVLEGLDGSGKETTSKALEKFLKNKGYSVLTVSFPMYDKWHSFLVRWFLKGKLVKSPFSIPPRITSLFYSIDRIIGYHFSVLPMIEREEDLVNGFDFIIFDRYSTSNMIYQGAKAETFKEGLSIVKFNDFVEHILFRLPRPNKVFALMTNSKQSREAMKVRKDLDLHERDFEYQQRVENFFNFLIYEKKWCPIATREFEPPYDWIPLPKIVNVIYEQIDDWAK